MAQVSQSKFKSWIFHKALSSKEADLKKFVLTTTGLLILERFSFELPWASVSKRVFVQTSHVNCWLRTKPRFDTEVTRK